MLKHLRNSEEWSEKSLPQKGFTLVELLVVIVILGILAAVVVFAVGGSTEKAQTNSCKAEKSAVETAVEAYRASTGTYPASAAAMGPGTDNQFLRSIPSYYQVNVGGVVTKTAAGVTTCTGSGT